MVANGEGRKVVKVGKPRAGWLRPPPPSGKAVEAAVWKAVEAIAGRGRAAREKRQVGAANPAVHERVRL